MTAGRATYEEMKASLCEAESVLAALRNQEVDAIVGDDRIAMVRLREVEESLRQAQVELERQIAERTTDLVEANQRLRDTIERETTTRRQLEQYTLQLREQAHLLDLAHDMIFVHDMEGRIVFWNRGAERAYGWKREEALGRLSDELLQTEYREPLIRITSQIIRDGWWEGELTHTTREGRKATVATRWALRRGADGSPTAILEIDNDITERRRAELEMAEARRFAENIVDTIQECLVVLDSQLRVVSANRSFYETFGTTQEQVLGRFFLTLNDGAWDVPELRLGFRKLLTQGESLQGFEMECGSAGGGHTLVLSARPVRDQPVGAGMVLVVLQDVTVCKRQEREIQTDKQQLASLTEELMLIEERQRRQIAEVLHDSIVESLTRVEQELGILRRDAPAPMRDSLERLREQVCRAVEWTGSLARELSPVILHPEGLAGAVRELAEQFRDCEGFACRVEAVQTPLPLASPVCTLLYRAVRELLVNVTKHAEARNVEITLDRDERNVRVCVADDGRGFDPSVLESARADGGLGIQDIRERLTGIGGKLIIESIEGRGTRVTLVAPLDLEDGSDRGAREHAEKD